MSKKVIVIGAGFGGLSAACLIAKEGFDVTLIEKNEDVGGRGRKWEKDGYTFDMGPSWYLMPEAFDNFFDEMGTSTQKELNLTRLDPSYRIFFGEDDYVDISANLQKNLELFEKLEPGVTPTFLDYLDKAQKKYEISIEEVLYTDYKRYSDFFTLRLLKEGPKLDILTNLDKLLKKTFKSEKLRKILAYTVVFLGSEPKKTPGVYSLMSHADFNKGVFYPEGGLNGVAQAMRKVGERHGVKFKFNEPVQKIIVKDKKVRGVKTSKTTYKADKVVVNADYHFAETQLLEKKYRTYNEKYWSKRTMAPSSYLLYLGIDKKVKNLEHHNLFFHDDWETHFDQVFNNPSWPEDFHVYVCCASKTDKSVAPKGKENMFALMPVASGLDDSDEIRAKYADKIIDLIEKITGDTIRDHIEVKRIFTHRDFKSEYNAYKGTALGIAHTLMQTAVFRPSQRSKKVKNLYYNGQYTHPGIGVPMVIIGGHIVRDIVLKEDD